MSWNELRLRAGVQGQLQQIPAVQPEDGPAVGADVPDGLQLGGQQVRRLQRGEKDKVMDLPGLSIPLIDGADLTSDDESGRGGG